MNVRKFAGAAISGGIALVVVSLAWPYIVPGEKLWDDAQARELNVASESLHEAMHAHGSAHDHGNFGAAKGNDAPEVVAAAERYRTAQAGLARATFWTESAARYVRWTGMGLCLAGVAAFAGARGERAR